MIVRDIMIGKVVTASPDETVAVGAWRMLKDRVGSLVLMEGSDIEGIITDRDLLGCLRDGHDPRKCELANHMSTPVAVADPQNGLMDVAKQMSEMEIKRMPVAIQERLVGLISFSDISMFLSEQSSRALQDLYQVVVVTKAQSRHWRGKRI